MIRKAAGIFLILCGTLLTLAFTNEVSYGVEEGKPILTEMAKQVFTLLFGLYAGYLGYRVYTKQIK